ncbi:MAG TPA: MFS transporter [Candidatus Thermoplasmatota archaeon]|nr:MFS transporter [Candidatus Thermoplasmatota archaeon]
MALFARIAAPYREGLQGVDRRVYVVVTMTLLAIAARMSVYTFLGIYFTRDVGIALSVVGAAYLVENVLRGLIAPVVGALSDRIGRRPVLLASSLLSAAILPLFLFVRTPLELFLWTAAIGAAQAGAFPTTSALLLDLTPPEKRRAVLGLNYTMLSIGYTLGVAPAGFLLAYGFTSLALASALAQLLVVAVLVLGLRRLPPPERPETRSSLASDLARAPRDPAFLLLAALAIVFPLGIGLIATVAPLYAQDAGVGTGEIGLALAVNGPLLAILSIPVATWLTRHGPYRHLVHSAAFLAASYLFFVWSGGFAALILASVVFTAGELVFSSALPAAIAALAPPGMRGAYQGAWALVHSIGFGAAVFLTGIAQPAIGWQATWILWTLVTMAATVGLLLARPRFRRLADARAALASPVSAAAAPEAA